MNLSQVIEECNDHSVFSESPNLSDGIVVIA